MTPTDAQARAQEIVIKLEGASMIFVTKAYLRQALLNDIAAALIKAYEDGHEKGVKDEGFI